MNKKQETYQTVKIWVKTQQSLKLLSALLHKSMIEVLDELVAEKLEQVAPKGETK